MPEQKLLVIGAGIGQVPILEKARQSGIHTCVVTLPGNQPGIALADEVFYRDIYDRDAIVRWSKENGVTAVISDQNDLMNPTVAYVAEKLGLPGNSFAQVLAYTNKNRYREICDRIGNPVPCHIAITDASSDGHAFACPLPWIVKPADSQSSVGITKIEKMEDLQPAIAKALAHSKTKSAILEEFFEGQEVVCEGFIENGRYYLLAFADRRYFSLQNAFIPAQSLFPSTVRPDLLGQIRACEQKFAEYVHPSFGIVHSEYLVNEETGEICVVESALRGGGVYISSHLVPLATGIDINEVLLEKALGNKVDVEEVFSKRKAAAAAYICFYLPEGTIRRIEGVEELKKLPFVRMVCLDDIRIGDTTQPMIHKGMRKGPILICGNDRAEVEENIEAVQNILKIEVEAPDGEICGIVWE